MIVDEEKLFQLKKIKTYETIDHKHNFLLTSNSGRHYIWNCDPCNAEYKILKIIFYRQFKAV